MFICYRHRIPVPCIRYLIGESHAFVVNTADEIDLLILIYKKKFQLFKTIRNGFQLSKVIRPFAVCLLSLCAFNGEVTVKMSISGSELKR